MPIPGMDDKLMASDCLASQKFLASCYNMAITECANQDLRRDFFNIYQDEQNCLKMVFDSLNARGWYNLQMANMQDINQLQQQMRQEAMRLQAQVGVGPVQMGQMGFQPRA
ncbi:Coat F domain-containing protein [Thermanaeromonas toyohensis ToBE]|uniref:Coat F domain-containing protein n=1 Tax=Thermanaeromonas toyohensis ToBE TaxID=698762 RepID=A0A1W1W0A3_9FIRM|nr:spore coat protein [Thermanaeromonas toyohensis]SMB99047.1 Coat F domain-containing protein [Thermanaeromonas toyohensis ToBE]